MIVGALVVADVPEDAQTRLNARPEVVHAAIHGVAILDARGQGLTVLTGRVRGRGRGRDGGAVGDVELLVGFHRLEMLVSDVRAEGCAVVAVHAGGPAVKQPGPHAAVAWGARVGRAAEADGAAATRAALEAAPLAHGQDGHARERQ